MHAENNFTSYVLLLTTELARSVKEVSPSKELLKAPSPSNILTQSVVNSLHKKCLLNLSLIHCTWTLLPIAYVLDTGFHVFFWVGKEASSQVRSRGFAQAKVHNSVDIIDYINYNIYDTIHPLKGQIIIIYIFTVYRHNQSFQFCMQAGGDINYCPWALPNSSSLLD